MSATIKDIAKHRWEINTAYPTTPAKVVKKLYMATGEDYRSQISLNMEDPIECYLVSIFTDEWYFFKVIPFFNAQGDAPTKWTVILTSPLDRNNAEIRAALQKLALYFFIDVKLEGVVD